MPLKVGTVEPTQIIVDYPSQSFDVSSPNTTATATKIASVSPLGSATYSYSASATATYTYTHKNLKLNGILLTPSLQVIKTQGFYTYNASYSSGTLTIRASYYQETTASAASTKPVKFLGSTFTAIPCVELTRVEFIGLGSNGSRECWGKPYTVTRNAGANTSIRLYRSYSSYENAATGTVAAGGKNI